MGLLMRRSHERGPFGLGSPIKKAAIIPWSSWSRKWQWNTVLPSQALLSVIPKRCQMMVDPQGGMKTVSRHMFCGSSAVDFVASTNAGGERKPGTMFLTWKGLTWMWKGWK
eukprot:CAMPEP_0181192908 /NCGR_PEP_ID=MMETSP1096-20121128/13536_1 /TAXON_ID=156174 ORGANISM="Chrysochromulina ericina, Strain CCMP281" /NCGR_SAMPLE_ID=MMETSP1096 /ASSEMBLY_ACC=CAM_ASM_000453 /LENGTH=110 /DNA_ID=CAMNT_0023282339 /DNA_START=679 /DNA_END=1011 /DNA_ORIENTATION=-